MAKRANKEELLNVDIVLTANEINTLNGEPAELWKLYIELSRRRDFATSMTGQKSKISDRAFKEMMEVTMKQGREPKKPTTKHITRWLSQLETLGMIKPFGNYVFLLPKAPKHESVKNKCHQSVTKSVTTSVTNSSDAETPIKKLENSNIESEVSPEVSPQVSRKLGIPLNTLHNITLPSAQDFFQLLAKAGFPLHQIQGNKSTLAMVHEWVKAKVTLEEAQIGINHVNSGKGIPNSPAYYLKPVLQVRSDFEKAHQQASEVKTHVKPPSTTSSQQRYPKSATRQFWENAEEIMRGFNESED